MVVVVVVVVGGGGAAARLRRASWPIGLQSLDIKGLPPRG